MLVDIVNARLGDLIGSSSLRTGEQQLVFFSLFLVVTLLYFTWRIWKFTVQPRWHSKSPKELPYALPVFGHSLGFLNNANALMERGLNYIRRSNEIYAIPVLGQKLYIVTAPEDVPTVFRHSSISFDGHLNELLLHFGLQGEGLRLTWLEPKPGDPEYLPDGLIVPRQKSLLRLTEEVYRQQLLPGQKMDVMSNAFIDALLDQVRWNALDFCTRNNSGGTKQVSLHGMVRQFIVDATVKCMFGTHLHDIDSDVVKHMMSFNDNAWMIVFQYPSRLSSPVKVPQTKMLSLLRTFIELPEAKRSQQAWSVRTILKAQQLVGVDLHSRASLMLMILWAANANEYNLAFWMLSRMALDKDLLDSIQLEVDAAWSSGSLDIKSLCANSPRLNGLFLEVLRVNSGTMITRQIVERVELGGKTLEPGNTLIIPTRILHRDEKVWGHDVDSFDVSRFIKRKELARHSAYRPFGGGSTYCPGRYLSKEQAFSFIGILMHRYDIGLAPTRTKQKLPKQDDHMPTLGITGPMKGDDIILDVRHKAN